MRTLLSTTALVLLLQPSAHAQESWTAPTDIQAGERGSATLVVDRIDTTDRRISGSFADTDGTLTARVSSNTTFRGFADEPSGGLTVGFGGLGSVMVGDRLRVLGTGVSTGVMQAEDIRLAGRAVTTTPPAAAQPAVLEGTVRSVSRTENRFAVETAGRDVWTVVGDADTGVIYEGRTYGIGNLEAGDGVRVTVSAWDGNTAIASQVEVLRDARASEVGTLTTVSGRITGTRSSARRATLETVRGDLVDLDLTGATDELGRRFSAADLSIGDEVDVSGRSGADGSFRVSLVRTQGAAGGTLQPFDLIATIGSAPGTGGLLQLEDSQGVRSQVTVHPDQPVRFRPGRWFRASELQPGDRVRVRGLRAGTGELVAQVIEIESMADDAGGRN